MTPQEMAELLEASERDELAQQANEIAYWEAFYSL